MKKRSYKISKKFTKNEKNICTSDRHCPRRGFWVNYVFEFFQGFVFCSGRNTWHWRKNIIEPKTIEAHVATATPSGTMKKNVWKKQKILQKNITK